MDIAVGKSGERDTIDIFTGKRKCIKYEKKKFEKYSSWIHSLAKIIF